MTGRQTTVPKRCESARADGQPCRAFALDDGSGHCYSHAPHLEAEREAARRRGGHNSAKVVRLRALMPARLLPLYERLEQALEDVLLGELDPRRAAAAAALARAMISAVQVGELEELVREWERERAEQKGAA